MRYGQYSPNNCCWAEASALFVGYDQGERWNAAEKRRGDQLSLAEFCAHEELAYLPRELVAATGHSETYVEWQK